MLDFIANFCLLVVSLGGLLFFADKLVDHAVKLAAILGVSATVIGLTLLAYGTSMPEFSVSTIASFQQHAELSVSNVIGSNIYNIAVIMGVVAIIAPFAWKEDLRRDGRFMMASTLLLVPLAFLGGIGAVAGLMMVAAIVLYSYYVVKKDEKKDIEGHSIKKASGSANKEIGWCILLLLGVLAMGSFTVYFAVETARQGGIPEWLIGSTIVAAGTSMPETVVSIVSARKKQMGMALGNIVGSNYFNVLLILGASGLVRPLPFTIQQVWADLVFLLVITTLFYFALVKKKITKPEGMLYLAVYMLFLLYLLKASQFSFPA
jgi:cation:H+ antiporter